MLPVDLFLHHPHGFVRARRLGDRVAFAFANIVLEICEQRLAIVEVRALEGMLLETLNRFRPITANAGRRDGIGSRSRWGVRRVDGFDDCIAHRAIGRCRGALAHEVFPPMTEGAFVGSVD